MERAIAEPSAIAALWRVLRRLDKGKINSTWMAARNSLAVALPLGAAIALGNPLVGVGITTGALNVSFSDGRDPYASRARRMVTWSVVGAIAVFTGSVTGKFHFTAIVVAGVWAFVAGMMMSISSKAGDLGLNTLVGLIVFAARGAMPLRGAMNAALLVLAGGLLQTAFALLFWPVRRYEPERRAIGAVYRDLAKIFEAGSDALTSAPLDPGSAQAQDTLSALGRDHSIEGERFRLLFDQADRLRLSIYMAGRLRAELRHYERNNNGSASEALECLNQLLDLSGKLLSSVSQCLISNECIPNESGLLEELGRITQAAQVQSASGVPLLKESRKELADSSPESGRVSAPFALAREIGPAADVLAGQLRLAVQLADHSTANGLEAFAKRESEKPWRLQISNWLSTLRANLDRRSAVYRHAIRLCVCVMISDAIGRSISWERSYWLPMTVAVVLKPDFTTTISRGFLRLAGTFVGLILATVLYHALPSSALTQLLLVGIFTFFLRSIGPANYGVFSVAISGLIVFLIAATGTPPAQVVLTRGLNTAAGGVFALIAYAIWPTWERTQISDVLADMLDACRDYFHTVVQRFGRDAPSLAFELNEKRDAWIRARSNADASVDRIGSEPGITREKLDALTSILASSHALVHAIAGLEAGAIRVPAHTPPDAFETLAIDVEFTLYFLSAALRGSPAASRVLPKLRKDHRRLIEARENFSPLDEFVIIETDRLTVSLNTLREQVERFLG